MVDKTYYNYYKKLICFDPVNYYVMFTKDDLLKIKHTLTDKEKKELENQLSEIMIDYEKEKRSVIYKTIPIKGIDLKDYISLGTYYWPNKMTSDGLPYVQHDGLANPEGDLYDKQNLRELAYTVYYQSLLYVLTENKTYYDLLVKNIKYYFLDDLTGMNPNMNHSQMIKGVNLGRGIGMIDYAGNFSYALAMLKNLRELGLLDKQIDNELCQWLNKFVTWVNYSPIALQEKYSDNNHGIFYDFLLIVIYDFIGNKKEIEPLVYNMIEARMLKEIEKDGSMPKENARTKSKNYSLMAVKGIYDFSFISSQYGFDLWNINSWYYKRVDNMLEKATCFLETKLIDKKEEWTFEQIIPFDESTVLPLLIEKIRHEKGYNINQVGDIVEKLHVNFIPIKLLFVSLLK